MTYWVETMQDDLFLISSEGWKINFEPIKNKEGKAVGWDCPLLPKEIMSELYFKELKDQLEKLESEMETVVGERQTLDEENSGDDDMFSEVRNEETGRITKKALRKRTREIKNDPEYKDEFDAIEEYAKVLEKESSINSQKKGLEKLIDRGLREKFNTLDVEEIKNAVIEVKWYRNLEKSLHDEVDQAFYQLADRIRELEERYAVPLPDLVSNVENLGGQVEAHLRELGFKW